VDEEVPEKSQLKPATIAMTTWFSSNRQPTWPVKRDMKHTACAFSARAIAYVVRATDFSYVGGKFEAQKSCEMQTICAIMKEIRVVTGTICGIGREKNKPKKWPPKRALTGMRFLFIHQPSHRFEAITTCLALLGNL